MPHAAAAGDQRRYFDRAWAENPGQRLARVIAGGEQRMMPVAFEIRLCQFLVAVRLDAGRVQPDAGGALKLPVRDPDRRQRPGLRPRVPPRLVHSGGDLAADRFPAGRGLLQRPPRGRHRRDRAEQLPLVAHHPEIADHPGPVRDRARQVREHPAPVMTARQATAAPPTGPAVSPVRSASSRSRTSPACDTTPVPPPVTSRPRDHPVACT